MTRRKVNFESAFFAIFAVTWLALFVSCAIWAIAWIWGNMP